MNLWPRAKADASTPPPEAVQPGHYEFEEVAPYYDTLMASVPYGRWVDYVERLLAIYHSPALRVLDLACGTGQVGVSCAGAATRPWARISPSRWCGPAPGSFRPCRPW